MENAIYKIKPAGRHILTVGSGLIKDKYAALVELVKNSFDADANEVSITFKVSKSRQYLGIMVKDDGHGMSKNDIISNWLVLSTDNKHKRRTSPKGRVMLGNKGVGRYSASILGSKVSLKTVTEDGEKSEVTLNWNDFEQAQFLDDVEIEVNTTHCYEPKGTTLTIYADQNEIYEWKDSKQTKQLKYELSKLVSPIKNEISQSADDKFSIQLSFINLFDDPSKNERIDIQPYPVFELFDYRITGKVNNSGNGELTFYNQRIPNALAEKVIISNGFEKGCGELFLDLRVYDRDKEGIENLIMRGLKDDDGNYVGKLDARRLLNEYNGIGVYRSGFRIRPLGDADFDWLQLNKRRVQNPSKHIGSDQVIGFVQIQSEEDSDLIEKSARDGLRENESYEILKVLCLQIIEKLETRRFVFRRSMGLSKSLPKIEANVKSLFDYNDLRKGVEKNLNRAGLSEDLKKEILLQIDMKEQKNNKIAEELQEAVAIYQGQATVGKIVHVILHEGRKPLNAFKNQIPNIMFWIGELEKDYNLSTVNEILDLAKKVDTNASIFVNLFSKLDPLNIRKNTKRTNFNISKVIDTSLSVFESTLIENQISKKIVCPNDLLFWGYEHDFYIIFTNLIENSIFWLIEGGVKNRSIEFHVEVDEQSNLRYIEYKDTGPGIDKKLIETEVIFDPEFTTKPNNNGTGLGLAIAGEAAERNNLKLKAYYSELGAYFRLDNEVGEK